MHQHYCGWHEYLLWLGLEFFCLGIFQTVNLAMFLFVKDEWRQELLTSLESQRAAKSSDRSKRNGQIVRGILWQLMGYLDTRLGRHPGITSKSWQQTKEQNKAMHWSRNLFQMKLTFPGSFLSFLIISTFTLIFILSNLCFYRLYLLHSFVDATFRIVVWCAICSFSR